MKMNALAVINFAFIVVTWCSDSSVAGKLTGSTSNATVMITSGTRIQQMQRFVCERPPRWTIDATGRSINNGTISPMQLLRGNVTVIALLKGATNYALQQAERIKTLASILESNGLDDVKLLIINSRDVSSARELPRLVSTVNGSNVQVIQETNESKIWSSLGGHRGDIFVYDRCGRLTYYIPNPLSILTASRPIIQATILSTYFDKPCGIDCSLDDVHSDSTSFNSTLLPSNDISMRNTLKYISSHTRMQSNVTDDTVTVQSETNSTDTASSRSKVITSNNNDSDDSEDEVEQENHNIYDTNNTMPAGNSSHSNNTLDNGSLFEPWKIFEFFLNSIKDDSSLSSSAAASVVTSPSPINESLSERAQKNSSRVTSDESSSSSLMNVTIEQTVHENNRDGKKFTINSMSSGNSEDTIDTAGNANISSSGDVHHQYDNSTIDTNDQVEKGNVTTVQSNVLQVNLLDNSSSHAATIDEEGEENKSDTKQGQEEERGRSKSNLSNSDDNDHRNNNNNNNNSESNNNTRNSNDSQQHRTIQSVSNCDGDTNGTRNAGQLGAQNTTNEFTSSTVHDNSSIIVDHSQFTHHHVDSPSASINSPSAGDSIVPVQEDSNGKNCSHVTAPIECDASKCIDFSTDKMLRARLCCMKEDDFTSETSTSSKTGCASYTKSTCSQMLPLIKCCLKDFKELLAQYFNSQRSIHNSSVHSNNFFG